MCKLKCNEIRQQKGNNAEGSAPGLYRPNEENNGYARDMDNSRNLHSD